MQHLWSLLNGSRFPSVEAKVKLWREVLFCKQGVSSSRCADGKFGKKKKRCGVGSLRTLYIFDLERQKVRRSNMKTVSSNKTILAKKIPTRC